MDYGEALVVLEGCVKRLKDTLPRGRWVESMEVSILAEQHLRALVEECKRQDRLLNAPADHSPRLAYKPEERSTTVIYAHFYPDEG